MSVENAQEGRHQNPRLVATYRGLGFLNNILLIPMFTVMVLEATTGQAQDKGFGFEEANQIFCMCFLIEWGLGFWLAGNRLQYFIRPEKLIDLLSSIPFGYMFQSMRAVRLLRLLRVLRIIGRARKFSGKGSHLVRLIGIVGSTVLAGALGLRVIEPETVTSFSDALWWSLVTLSTVGYGDIAPVTQSGRILAGILITLGIGVFGYAAGFVSSLMEPPEDQELKESIRRLEEKVDALSKKLDQK